MQPNTPDLTLLAPELVEALEPAELAALEHALAESEPRSTRALAHWAAARAHVAGRLAAELPPAELLVLYALSEEPATLNAEEVARLDEARVTLDAVLADHPGLQSVIDRVRADREAFYGLWEEAAEPETRRRRADDRPPARAARARPPVARRWAWRAAVTVAVVLFVAALVLIAQRDIGFETVQTAEGELRELSLPDGSVVQLGPESHLAFRVMPDERRLRLTGEALFEVVPAEAPFIVETQGARLTVVGTIFGVTAAAARTEVVLVEGALEVAARIGPEASVRLAPGERSAVVAGQPPARPEAVDVAAALAWTGTWYFRATPLAEIAERVGWHYDVEIEVPRHLADERISGAFAQDAPVEQTLRTVATALGIRVERETPERFRFTSPED